MASPILNLLRLMGRGVKKVPRVIDDALFEKEPMFKEPGTVDLGELRGRIRKPFTTTDPEGVEPENRDVELSVDLSQAPSIAPRRQIGEKRKPSAFSRRLIDNLRKDGGGLLSAGIDAAATPNLAFGGPTDIFRAMQAAEEGPIRRALQQAEVAQAREQTSPEAANLRRRGAEADIVQREASAIANIARARSLTTPRRPGLINVGGALYDPVEQKWIRPPAKDPALKEAWLKEYVDGNPDKDRRELLETALGLKRDTRQPNPTEASIAYEAAKGDPVAKKAWDLLQSKPKSEDLAGARQKRSAISAAWQRYQNELNDAEQQFSQAKTQLDKAKPGSEPPPGQTPLSPADYENRLFDLETNLQNKKNNVQTALEMTLAEFDVPVTSARFPHPSQQRRSGMPTGQTGQGGGSSRIPVTRPGAKQFMDKYFPK